MAEDKELYQRKNGFLLYKNYIKTVNKMTNEQAGELFKIILHYANTGELLESEDPRVDTALDFIGERLEFNMQSYAETCQKNAENAAMGGRPKKEAADEKQPKPKKDNKKAEKERKEERNEERNEANKPTGFSEKPKKPDIDTDTDTDTDTDNDTDTDTETETEKKTSRHPHPSRGAGVREDEPHLDNQDQLICYGENKNPTTRAVIAQMESLASELIRKYCGRAAYENDVQNVFNKCYTVAELPDGELYAAYSPEKAALLRYAFQQAGNAGSANWKYIEGIYDNFEKRRITTVDEAVEKEYEWQRGKISA